MDRFRKGETVIIGCPLLEDPDMLTLVLKETAAKEVEVFTMEVPCCHAIHMMAMAISIGSNLSPLFSCGGTVVLSFCLESGPAGVHTLLGGRGEIPMSDHGRYKV